MAYIPSSAGVLTDARSIAVAAGGSIQDAINSFPPVLAATATITVEGSKSNPQTYSSALNFDFTCAKGGFLILQPVTTPFSDVHTGVLSCAGGGADWFSVLKAALATTSATEWASCQMKVLEHNVASFASGDVRTINASGAVSSSADGTVPGDETCWKFTTTASFSNAMTSAAKVCLASIIIGDGTISAFSHTGGVVKFERLALNGQYTLGAQYMVGNSNIPRMVPRFASFSVSDLVSGNAMVISGGLLNHDTDRMPIYIVGGRASGSRTQNIYFAGGFADLDVDYSTHGYGYNSGGYAGLNIANDYPGAGARFGGIIYDSHSNCAANVEGPFSLTLKNGVAQGSSAAAKTLRASRNGVIRKISFTSTTDTTATQAYIYT